MIADTNSQNSVQLLTLLGYLCVFNLFLLLVSIAYIVFCFVKKYYLDILLTTLLQASLTFFSVGTLIGVGLLLGGEN